MSKEQFKLAQRLEGRKLYKANLGSIEESEEQSKSDWPTCRTKTVQKQTFVRLKRPFLGRLSEVGVRVERSSSSWRSVLAQRLTKNETSRRTA